MMTYKISIIFDKFFTLALPSLFFIIFFTAGCAYSSGRIVDHAFEFDVRDDSPEVVLIDYAYGRSSQPGARPGLSRNNGQIRQRAGTSGEMLVADTLYVKWKVKDSDEIIEDTVDLKNLLPIDLKGNTVYFMIKGRNLHVYLVTRKLRSENEPPLGPKLYSLYVVKSLYPILK